MADLSYKLSDAPPAVQPPLEKWSHEEVMKWFNSLPENDKKKFGAFFNDPKRFPLEAEGKDLARMKEERFVALLGDVLGASLYEELQPLKAKAASSPSPAQPSDAHLLELVQELVDAHREKKQRKSAVAMSDVRDDVWLELQAALGLEVKTVGCNLSVTGSVTAFKWDERDEDKRSDYSDWWQALLDPKKVRVAVMNGNAGNYSLTIPLLEGIPFRLSGTTDVAVVDSHSAITTTPVVGTLFVIEIKKPAVFKKETLHWTRQLQAELLAADYHSQHAPVGLLTDLASEWHFFWFEKDANTKKLCTAVVASAALAVALMRATILLLDPSIASSSRAKSPARGDSTPSLELRLEAGGRSKSPRRATSEIPETPWHRRTHVVPRTKALAP